MTIYDSRLLTGSVSILIHGGAVSVRVDGVSHLLSEGLGTLGLNAARAMVVLLMSLVTQGLARLGRQSGLDLVQGSSTTFVVGERLVVGVGV